MPRPSKPQILVVDDQPDEAQPLKIELGDAVHLVISHPADLTEDQLHAADLVLIDFRLDDWQDRDNMSSPSLKPMNGIALAAVLRSQIHNRPDVSPKAFAIYSGYLDDLSGRLPPEPRAHAIARAHNLEWAFAKKTTTDGVPLYQQIVSLARAVRQLPVSWPTDNPKATQKQLQNLLSLPEKAGWAQRAWGDVEDCFPPTHELSNWSHGLAVLRWLLRRILPYPCFLLDSHYLAARLRVTHNSLVDALGKKTKLSNTFQPARYSGVLSQFLGDRWWRAGIEAALWKVTNGNSFDAKAVQSALSTESSAKLHPVHMAQPVVCLDENYTPLGKFSSMETAVRIQPDDWPPYADQAWTTVDLAKTKPLLFSLVVRKDRGKLNSI